MLFVPVAIDTRDAFHDLADNVLVLGLAVMVKGLNQLLDQSALVRVKPEDLQPLLDFVATTGQDFAQLGN